jgi:hypothetical protein
MLYLILVKSGQIRASLTSTFTYNPASQLATTARSNDAYAWKAHYNVNRPYTSNSLNQYTLSGTVTPTYDARGNLTSAGGPTYGYTIENRLVSAVSIRRRPRPVQLRPQHRLYFLPEPHGQVSLRPVLAARRETRLAGSALRIWASLRRVGRTRGIRSALLRRISSMLSGRGMSLISMKVANGSTRSWVRSSSARADQAAGMKLIACQKPRTQVVVLSRSAAPLASKNIGRHAGPSLSMRSIVAL